MAELSYNAIMDYYRCPLLYKFKHVLKLDPEDKERELFNEALQKVVMFYYYNVMNGRVPSLDNVRNKWDKLWNRDKGTAEDVLFKRETKLRLYNYNLEGITIIDKFYHEETTKEFVPIIVDTDIRIPVGRHYVTGTIELAREVKGEGNPFLELVRFTNSRYRSDQFMADHDFKTSFQSYAFRKLFETREDRLMIRNLKTNARHLTQRGENEFNRMIAIVNNVGDAVDQERFYPIVTHMCMENCEFKSICDKYKFD